MIWRWFPRVAADPATSRPPPARAVSAAARQFDRHQRAQHALFTAEATHRAAIAAAEQQAATVGTTVDDARILAARARDLRASTDLVREALERVKLLALNAGLEGARLGEPAGRILVTLADEVRSVAARGLDSLGEHVQLLAQVDRERERLETRLGGVSDAAATLAQELARATRDHEVAAGALAELEADLRRTPGADPDAARAVADAAQHATALLAALDRLAPRARRNLLLDALRPLLRQLLRVVNATPPGSRPP